jgi:hypothetical protein
MRQARGVGAANALAFPPPPGLPCAPSSQAGGYAMSRLKYPVPEWVTRGKTIRQLIAELQAFENQDLEVRMSLDYGDTHSCISQVAMGDGGKYCVLMNAESYHENEWQTFKDQQDEAQ